MFSDNTIMMINNLAGYLNVLSSAGKLAQSDVTVITKAVNDISKAAYVDGSKPDTVVPGRKLLETEFYCVGRGADAWGYYLEDNKFMVKKGSKVSHGITDSFRLGAGPVEVRTQLENDGTIVNGVFAKDHVFNSPSQAAGVVQGTSSDGGAVWKDRNKVPLKMLKKQDGGQ